MSSISCHGPSRCRGHLARPAPTRSPSCTQPFRISGDVEPVAVLREVVAEAPLHAGASPGSGCSPRSTATGDAHDLGRPSRGGRSGSRRRSRGRPTWRPCPGCRSASAPNRCAGMNSKMAPVGQTRTHSPHQVQPAWSGSPSPPTMISVCSPRCATSSTPTTWMSSQARTQRVQRMQSDMSCWIITSPGRSSPWRSPSGCSAGRRRVVAHDVLLELVARGRPGRRSRGARPGSARAGARARPGGCPSPPGDSVCHHHAVGRRRGAGRQQLALALDRHEADAAVARRWGASGYQQSVGMSMPGRARRVEDGGALGDRHGLSVDCQRRHRLVRPGRGGDESSLRGFGSCGKGSRTSESFLRTVAARPDSCVPSDVPLTPALAPLRLRRYAGLTLATVSLAVIAWATLRPGWAHPGRFHPTRASSTSCSICCSFFRWEAVSRLRAAPGHRDSDRGAGECRHRGVPIALDRGRFASTADLIANLLGTAVGALVVARWPRRAQWWPVCAPMIGLSLMGGWFFGGLGAAGLDGEAAMGRGVGKAGGEMKPFLGTVLDVRLRELPLPPGP